MILRHMGPMGNDVSVSGKEGVPLVGAIIDNGGQYYHTVEKVTWQQTWLFMCFFLRMEPVVHLREHDRGEEAMDGYWTPMGGK